jgi:hypothetical protein
MNFGYILGGALLVAVAGFQAFVTHKIWRSDAFDRSQKVAQSKLIWLLPALGALMVYAMVAEEDRVFRNDVVKRSDDNR